MSVQIKTPNITGSSGQERLSQVESYLCQMARQLQWAFDTLETGGQGQIAVSSGGQNQKSKTQTDAQSTFLGLKNLIIKSADIVDAYYDKFSRRLEGQYVVQSDFGTYTQETALQIQGNAQGIEHLYSNHQMVASRMDGLEAENRELADSLEVLQMQSIQTNAYLKTGLLYENPDGTPVYGLEVGQTNSADGVQVFDKFARFAADRLSFFDSNDVEVAYISDYKLYITNAEITGTLYLSGRFKIYYKGGLAFQWTGGGG